MPGRNLHSHLIDVHNTWRQMEQGLLAAVGFSKGFDSVLACARPALHRPALPCTPLHCALDMDSYCICRPPGGTMMAFGRAYSAT